MRLPEGVIIDEASKGKMSIIVPDYPSKKQKYLKYVEYPNEWFCYLIPESPVRVGVWLARDVFLPARGTHDGVRYLTRTGWEANKLEIKREFEAALHRGEAICVPGWGGFEQTVEKHFRKVEIALGNRQEELLLELDRLAEFTI